MPALHQQPTAESLWSTDSADASPQPYSDTSPSPTDSGSLFTIAEMLEQYKPSWPKPPQPPMGVWRPHSTSSPVPSLDNQSVRPPSFSPFSSSLPLDSLVSWYNNNNGFDIQVTQPFSPISPVGGPAPNALRGYSPNNQHSDCSSPLMDSFGSFNRTSHSTSPSNSDSSMVSLNLSGGVFSPPTEQELANLRALHSLTWPSNESSVLSERAQPQPAASANQTKNQASAPVSTDAMTWCGVLPVRIEDEPMYSSKVFLGGVPWDVAEDTLVSVLSQFGKVKVEWPGKEHLASHPKGYVYVIFESEKQVKAMLNSCPRKVSTKNGRKWYFRISSRKMKSKEVQVIPWSLMNSNHVLVPAQKLDPNTTVFVGALHGMLTAEGLFAVMNDLFGGVVYAGIDTDKYKYPIGSARVTFDNLSSYILAVQTAFVEIKTTKFCKKVQIDPYLEDSACSTCKFQQGPYFCREFTCFRYFCRSCWLVHELLTNHMYITRSSKNSTGQPTQMRFSQQ
ncbi:cytoplasmic polyadenylation element-binding protein 1-like isoform X2 [Macrosteles quadrilineatus]|uniref:cytoplasmic polyadenylation element-binding protein 1-like isoform X2 n=1 Tax=Macrosteles quadrilineatus TaxID=74068 RepID=UPI0023E2BD45|nr:cytoplasmic polyadenylation element-binding protein 1-like isoform X2 [Macrosteles quadrilineatus]